MNAGRFSLSNGQVGQETSTPWPFTMTVVAPVLVACPIHGAAGMAASDPMVQELYQMAYEQAVAATRLSRYEWAFQTTSN